jgi:hypothetical protein
VKAPLHKPEGEMILRREGGFQVGQNIDMGFFFISGLSIQRVIVPGGVQQVNGDSLYICQSIPIEHTKTGLVRSLAFDVHYQ